MRARVHPELPLPHPAGGPLDVHGVVRGEHLPRDEAPWRDEDANDGVREGGYDESSEAAVSGLGLGLVDFYRPRAIGRALQAGSNDVARKDLVSSQLQVTAITTAAAGRRKMGVRPAADGTAQRKL